MAHHIMSQELKVLSKGPTVWEPHYQGRHNHGRDADTDCVVVAVGVLVTRLYSGMCVASCFMNNSFETFCCLYMQYICTTQAENAVAKFCYIPLWLYTICTMLLRISACSDSTAS